MKAFIDTPVTKERFVYHLKEHSRADAFIRGTYGKLNGTFTGCAVGCSIRSIELETGDDLIYSNHFLYEKYLGIPTWLARLEDRIFEGLPLGRAKTWPVEFGEAVVIGSDLDVIKGPFLIFVLEESLKTFDHDKYAEVKKSLGTVITCWKEKSPKEYFYAAAAYASAAASAADAAAAASAADAAAAYAADASAAAAAAYASAAADAAADAAAADREKTYVKFADKVLELMRGLV